MFKRCWAARSAASFFCSALSSIFVDMGDAVLRSDLQCQILMKESPFLVAQAWLMLLLSWSSYDLTSAGNIGGDIFKDDF